MIRPTMPDPNPRSTPEAKHLAEQERLLADLTEKLATKETEFAAFGAGFARFRAHYLQRLVPEVDHPPRLRQCSSTVVRSSSMSTGFER
jgi:hypothetical protein